MLLGNHVEDEVVHALVVCNLMELLHIQAIEEDSQEEVRLLVDNLMVGNLMVDNLEVHHLEEDIQVEVGQDMVILELLVGKQVEEHHLVGNPEEDILKEDSLAKEQLLEASVR